MWLSLFPFHQWKHASSEGFSNLAKLHSWGRGRVGKSKSVPLTVKTTFFPTRPLILHGKNVGRWCHAFVGHMTATVFSNGDSYSHKQAAFTKGTRLILWVSAEGKTPDSHFRKTGKVRYAYHQFIFIFFWENEGNNAISLSGAL